MEATVIQWLLRLLAHFYRQTSKRLRDDDKPSNFSCDACRKPLGTIFRYDDKSYCKSCRADIDSDESDDDAFNDRE